jgi:hypothetical protein
MAAGFARCALDGQALLQIGAQTATSLRGVRIGDMIGKVADIVAPLDEVSVIAHVKRS